MTGLPVSKRAVHRAVLALATLFSLATTASAQVPSTITQQGLLENASGSALSGTFDLGFELFTADTGGTAIWSETHAGVSVDDGVYAVQLGSQTSFESASVDFSAPYWLEMTVTPSGGGASETLAPRTELTAVPYALSVAGAPGVASSATNDASAGIPGVGLNSTYQQVYTLDVEVPLGGMLLVQVNALMRNFAQSQYANYAFSIDGEQVGPDRRFYLAGANNNGPTYDYLSFSHVIPVEAGTRTIGFLARSLSGGVQVFDRGLTALFVPTTIGPTN